MFANKNPSKSHLILRCANIKVFVCRTCAQMCVCVCVTTADWHLQNVLTGIPSSLRRLLQLSTKHSIYTGIKAQIKVWFSLQVTRLCNSEAAVVSHWVRENYSVITSLGISGSILYQHWEVKGVIYWVPSLSHPSVLWPVGTHVLLIILWCVSPHSFCQQEKEERGEEVQHEINR